VLSATATVLNPTQAVESKLRSFTLARSLLLLLVTLTTLFLRQEVLGTEAIIQIYIVLLGSFFLLAIISYQWDQALKVKHLIPAQIVFDLLVTSYLVYLTGIDDSVFLFLYLLNIVSAAVLLQLIGSLTAAFFSGTLYTFIYFANQTNIDAPMLYNLAWTLLLFLLTALLCGQLMDEIKKQQIVLQRHKADIAELQLQNEELLQSIPMGVILIDREDYIESINDPALRLIGLERPPEIRLKYFELIPSVRGIVSSWDNLTENQKLRQKLNLGPKREETYSVQVVRLRHDFGQAKKIIMLQDVTKLDQTEKRLEFESRLSAIGELSAGIAHEIRNPLASISGAIELLDGLLTQRSEQVQKLMSISLREIARLNRLITDFLEFAKPRDYTPEPLDLLTSTTETVESFQKQKAEGQTIEVNIEVTNGVLVNLNRQRFEQVLYNLLLNAKEACGTVCKISIVARVDEENAYLLFRDNGPGIPADLREKIFQPFFTTKKSGTGLGLSTVAQIIKASGGAIRVVDSKMGASFEIQLPLATPFGPKKVASS
jgi:two-component system, NtrC family, sensor histidine kinase PilS